MKVEQLHDDKPETKQGWIAFSSFKWPPPHFDKFILLKKKQSKMEIACQKIDTEHLT